MVKNIAVGSRRPGTWPLSIMVRPITAALDCLTAPIFMLRCVAQAGPATDGQEADLVEDRGWHRGRNDLIAAELQDEGMIMRQVVTARGAGLFSPGQVRSELAVLRSFVQPRGRAFEPVE
jgi:hypothetical protein